MVNAEMNVAFVAEGVLGGGTLAPSDAAVAHADYAGAVVAAPAAVVAAAEGVQHTLSQRRTTVPRCPDPFQHGHRSASSTLHCSTMCSSKSAPEIYKSSCWW